MSKPRSSCVAKTDFLQDALHAMGWNLETAIPMADAANLALAQEMQDVMAERAFLLSKGTELDRRRETLVINRKNAEATAQCNEKLLQALKVEEMKELNAMKVVQREIDKGHVTDKELDKGITEMESRLKRMTGEVEKRKDNVDRLTTCVNWVKTTLVEWDKAMEEGNRGYQLVEKYFKDDQIRAQQRERQRQNLQITIDRTRKELVAIYDERQVLELSLDGLAKLYRQASEERRNMVETWKGAVNLMTTRENDILRLEAELDALQKESQVVGAELQANEDLLNDTIEDNHEIEASIDEINNECSDLRAQMDSVTNMIILKEKEVENIRMEVQNLMSFIEQQRAENRRKKKEKCHLSNELINYGELIRKLTERWECLKDKNMTAQQRLQMIDDMQKAEDAAMDAINKETVSVNDTIYQTQLQRTNLRNEVKVLKAANDSIKIDKQATEKSMRKTRKTFKRQTEVHYEMAFKCIELERAIIKKQGGLCDPEVERQNKMLLTEMEAQNQVVGKRVKAIEIQNRKLDDEMRKLTEIFNADIENLVKINDRIKEAQIYFEGGVKQLKVEKIKVRALIVEHSLLKMSVGEYQKEIDSCNNSSYNLATHRAHLERTIGDRMIEIKGQTELLTMKRKHLNDEKGVLRADVAERNKHIEAVRARFELSMALLGLNDDGTPVTATQLRAEAALEKQRLITEGSELNDKILLAESELRAMDNTLSYINHCNDQLKKVFVATTEDANEQDAYNKLADSYTEHLNILKITRQSLAEIAEDITQKKVLLHRLEEQVAIEEEKRDNEYANLIALEKELEGQLVKIERAKREDLKYMKLVRKRPFTEEFLAFFERDLNLTDMENRNMRALNQLADLAQTRQAYGPRIVQLILQRGMTLPYHMRRTSTSGSSNSKMSEFTQESSKDLNLTSERSSSTQRSSSAVHSDFTAAVVNVIPLDFPAVNRKTK